MQAIIIEPLEHGRSKSLGKIFRSKLVGNLSESPFQRTEARRNQALVSGGLLYGTTKLILRTVPKG